ncbi:Gfo/Idh/MocA family protein [Fimbriimonas ginsengisoli]|uniref:Glucose-fructose oxidoreductase n=1 Tax=Fimbriimonas ginsengisoli Gsoil 348 TaxID=661478 RepID=A0A068NSB4_FIMGI|nr:Gfo/Idh/MocA family oxidoreductase [Fimbriimonas ginsengisoli]AIE84494.1 glucose-fructose oxidoreductase [Fimbriimonas ginsengisoli Gsoil 348]
MGELTRRELIAGAGALALSPHMFWRQEKTKPVGWAILGLGGYAQNQIMPAFAHCDHSRIVALISGHTDKLKRVGDRYGVPEKSRYLYETMDAIRDNSEIEAVYVITPPATHPEFAVRAAKAGKHVCSEKPMAPTPADCRRMIDACRKAGRLLQIGYRSHYETHNMRAIQACRSGELGHIKSIRSDHGFNMPGGTWRTQRALAGGGSMMDIGIYSLQALRYLSGEEPVEVTAKITNPPNDDRFRDVEDTVDFTLRFPSGLIGHGTSGYSWQPGKNRYEVVGDKHTLVSEPATSYGGNTLTLDGNPFPVTANDQFAAQIDHFSQCIRNHTKVRTPGEEGLRDIRIVQALYESARTGRPVRMRAS